MKSYEVHLISTETDLDLAEIAGLTDGVVTDECANCWEAIGPIADEEFEPFTIVLTFNDEGYSVCSDCSAPITHPDTDTEE